MALEELPPLVMGSVVLKEPAAMLLEPVWLEQLLRFDPEKVLDSGRNISNNKIIAESIISRC